MRCISKFTAVCICVLLAAVSICGCGSRSLPSGSMSFRENSSFSNYNFLVNESGAAEVADPFAWNLCIPAEEAPDELLEGMNDAAAGALFDLTNKTTLYAREINTRMYPASLTKIMTALVALENMTSDTILTASSDVWVLESNAQVAGINPGDTMTLDQALHLLLIYSANDVAIMIAENVGGSTSNFIQMMNDEAKKLGSTNTNFINSNGLSDQNHYTTPYDMYLIFNAAMQYTSFQEIINMGTYSTVYHDSNGGDKQLTVNSTNYYLMNYTKPPTGVTVIGGKTGTTTAAGHCLILLCRDISGNPYIAVIMRARDVDELYNDMNELLKKVPGRSSSGQA